MRSHTRTWLGLVVTDPLYGHFVDSVDLYRVPFVGLLQFCVPARVFDRSHIDAFAPQRVGTQLELCALCGQPDWGSALKGLVTLRRGEASSQEDWGGDLNVLADVFDVSRDVLSPLFEFPEVFVPAPGVGDPHPLFYLLCVVIWRESTGGF